ncbi:sugar transferase [Roseofilum reptotaenium CS-1145]|uniref:Sugar transferase n=1 Tax=Roseofilum reptotaenium AO1-A TaxID=1925591 RepID=A0A1L9QN24_9CYAN|nr:sugar transferase [Roseofilum reptotaenium]MDB9515741.1 sugar transferase [Roseofilum reptotaenium CS-1145]OJJ24083.1 sugar transferase [Roseofilum reptotaenium AO1-A]
MSSLTTLSCFTPHPSVHSPLKRLIDILGALVGLLLLSIIFIPVSIAIKLDSPGPILFTQKRYGLSGKPFTLYKFRSMVCNAEDLKKIVSNQARGMLFKNLQDPRITRVGHFLRKTSLDEFPQFWNVLKGEMSLVGTRPPIEQEVIQYNAYQWQRLNVKPGLTGEWQVNGRSQVKDFETVVALDLRYQERWNTTYDFIILVKTIWVVFHQYGSA